jgi:peptidoglycan hydrolase-like protein with peptidoglycan-binding domain
MPALQKSVGNGGVNQTADVKIVQKLLNKYAVSLAISRLNEDGQIGPGTIAAIRRFQTVMFGIDSPNGRVDPGGRTIIALNSLLPSAPLSGAGWWHANQDRYPNSVLISDLSPVFRDKAARFVNALRTAGANVVVGSTRRNASRAYLMHYCWQISQNSMSPAAVPIRPNCAINWDHGDLSASKKAAKDMAALFAMKHIASLESRHIQGEAIDMQIKWDGQIAVKDASGNRVILGKPRSGEQNSGEQNAALHEIGKSYGVIKLLSDPPHWSSDGK